MVKSRGFADRLGMIFALLAVLLWASGWISFSHLCDMDISLPVRRHLRGGRYNPSIRKSTVLMETFYTQSEDCIESFLLFHCIVFKYIESLSCGSIWKTLKSSALLFYLPPTVPAPPPSPGSTLRFFWSSLYSNLGAPVSGRNAYRNTYRRNS